MEFCSEPISVPAIYAFTKRRDRADMLSMYIVHYYNPYDIDTVSEIRACLSIQLYGT